MRSSDKPDCERNHGIARYPITKWKSLDNLTQKDVSDAFDNVNSLVRDTLGLKKIDRRKVKLTPVIWPSFIGEQPGYDQIGAFAIT